MRGQPKFPKIGWNRATLALLLINELRGAALVAPALLATLRLHHYL